MRASLAPADWAAVNEHQPLNAGGRLRRRVPTGNGFLRVPGGPGPETGFLSRVCERVQVDKLLHVTPWQGLGQSRKGGPGVGHPVGLLAELVWGLLSLRPCAGARWGLGRDDWCWGGRDPCSKPLPQAFLPAPGQNATPARCRGAHVT